MRVITNYSDGDLHTGDPTTDLVQVTQYDGLGRVDRTITNYVDGSFTATEPITDRITLTAYDTLGRVVTTTTNLDPSQHTRTDTNLVQTISYAATTGQVTGQQDALERWMHTAYDALGRVDRTITNYVDGVYDPAVPDTDITTAVMYDALGRATQTTANYVDGVYDPAVPDTDITTAMTYDGVGRVVTTTANYVDGGPTDAQTNVTTTTTYDGVGQVVATTDATGATTTLGYDRLGHTTVITDSLGRVTTIGYDGLGTRRWTQRPDGQITLIQVDGLGRPVATIVNYVDGVVGPTEPTDQDLIRRSRYDRAGRVIETVDPAGRVTWQTYDLQDHRIAVTEHVTATCAPTATDCMTTTHYQYDRAGNRTAIIDANGHVRRFSYDVADQQVESFDGLNRRTGWTYDRGGRMVSQDDPRGTANDRTWIYDGQDRLTSIDATNLDAIGMGYDALGRRTTLTDGTGTTTVTVDPLGRVTQVIAPNTGTVGYGYTARGERVQLTYPDGTVIDYTYLADGQLDTVTEGSTTLADYSYDALGRLDQAVMGNGAVTSYSYDNADHLRDRHTTVGGSTMTRFQYEVDRLGFRTQATETLSGTVRTIDYTYDGLLRLTGAIEIPGTSYSYSYDRVGNRTDGGRTYNAANEVVGLTYDDAGNLLNDGSTSYTYDALGRLTQQGGTSYTYNGDGVLVGRDSTSYTQDMVTTLEQMLNDGSTNHVYGHDRLMSDTNTWYQHDGVGSVRAVLDGAGAMQSTTSYDPWGEPTAGSVDPFGFTGELHDGELVHLRARWYHPTLGTLTSRDPFEGFDTQPYSLHPYQYACSAPTTWTDPSGKLAIFIAGGFGPGDPANVGNPEFGIWQMAAAFAGIPDIGPVFISDAEGGNTILQRIIDRIWSVPCLVEGHEPIILVGTSRGAATAHVAAVNLQRDFPNLEIDLLISIAMVPFLMDDGGEVNYETKPTNVRHYINIRSEQGGLRVGLPGANATLEERLVPEADEQYRILDTDHGTVDDKLIAPECLLPQSQNDPSRCTKVVAEDGTITFIPKKKKRLNPVWPIVEQAIRDAITNAKVSGPGS
ncbi:MAG: hypothetical protein GFH27_549327n3 [Chloroflexi bacterium AL-W]|nr:hypothetical protein [Chloroflexi bacterium AL-N1]NOK69615.1 hypothetical protein [Chloroflexi bacterium AL-N10]NOK72162.1 hypothetical protein [Chloroflexi bacterium AL-N5]NOK84991.1 hypothetical protein [Chloroflexi bacterium AL-W]NOK91744.1 hypothetical protein [Chloroflexi bacterium AL-N15]